MQTMEAIFNEFFEGIGRIEHLGATAYETSVAALRNHADLRKNDEGDIVGNEPVHFRRSAFRSVESGKLVVSDGKDFSADEIEEVFKENLNKQCQWLLVDAYELYEQFLYRAYAFVGFTDAKKWKCSDYGDVQLSEIDGKSYDWFLARVRATLKNRADEILRRMRNLYPEFANLEVKNAFDISLRFKVSFIEQVRHQVVHAGGRIADKDDFFNKIYQKSGLSLSADKATRETQTSSIYVIESEPGLRIFMFNRYTKLGAGFRIEHSPLNMACNALLSHAHILTNRILGLDVLQPDAT